MYHFQAPIGYFDHGGGKLKTVDPIKSPLIKKAFELYTQRGYSIRELVKKMYVLGLRNTRGNKVQKNGMLRILKNPFYAGIMQICDKHFEGKHESIITMKMWKRAQDIMQGKANAKVQIHAYTFRRLIRCKHCNFRLIGERQKGRVYYRCQTKECPTKTIREDELHKFIQDYFSNIALENTESKYFQKLISNTESEWKRACRDSLRSINLRLGEIEKREEKLMDAMLAGIIPEDQFQKRNQKILADKQELIDEKRNLTSNNSMNLRKYDNFLELVSNPIKLYDLANSEEKRDLVELFTSNLVVDIKSLEISTVSPFSEKIGRES